MNDTGRDLGDGIYLWTFSPVKIISVLLIPEDTKIWHTEYSWGGNVNRLYAFLLTLHLRPQSLMTLWHCQTLFHKPKINIISNSHFSLSLFFFLIIIVLGMEPMALCMLGRAPLASSLYSAPLEMVLCGLTPLNISHQSAEDQPCWSADRSDKLFFFLLWWSPCRWHRQK